jgi:hypothetical protein
MKDRLDEEPNKSAKASARHLHDIPNSNDSKAARPYNDLSTVYERIQKGKAEKMNDFMEPTTDSRPDPEFRIFHVDK